MHSNLNAQVNGESPKLNIIPSGVFVDVSLLQRQLSDALLQTDALKEELKIAHRDTDDARTMTNRLEGNLNGRLKELEQSHRLVEGMKKIVDGALAYNALPLSTPRAVRETAELGFWAIVDDYQQQGKRNDSGKKCERGVVAPAPGNHCANCGLRH